MEEIIPQAMAETQVYSHYAGHWLAQPIFSFDLDDENVLHLSRGMAKLRMFFHWDSWAKMIRDLGGEFRWLTDDEYRKTDEYRVSSGHDRFLRGYPYVTFGNVSFIPASTHMVRIFSDLLRPKVLAQLAQPQGRFQEE